MNDWLSVERKWHAQFVSAATLSAVTSSGGSSSSIQAEDFDAPRQLRTSGDLSDPPRRVGIKPE